MKDFTIRKFYTGERIPAGSEHFETKMEYLPATGKSVAVFYFKVPLDSLPDTPDKRLEKIRREARGLLRSTSGAFLERYAKSLDEK